MRLKYKDIISVEVSDRFTSRLSELLPEEVGFREFVACAMELGMQHFRALKRGGECAVIYRGDDGDITTVETIPLEEWHE